MEQRVSPCTDGGNVNRCGQCGKQYEFSLKLKIELSYDPASPLLGIYLKETKILMKKLHEHQSL